jgi:hypothetical protein
MKRERALLAQSWRSEWRVSLSCRGKNGLHDFFTPLSLPARGELTAYNEGGLSRGAKGGPRWRERLKLSTGTAVRPGRKSCTPTQRKMDITRVPIWRWFDLSTIRQVRVGRRLALPTTHRGMKNLCFSSSAEDRPADESLCQENWQAERKRRSANEEGSLGALGVSAARKV